MSIPTTGSHLVLDTIHSVLGPPINCVWKITRILSSVEGFGVVSMVHTVIGQHLFILRVSLYMQ